MFLRVTLPNIKWGLLYGVILCNARAMGEFGAVSVVSGQIRGETTTLPLHVEILYNEYQFQAAFAVASLLAVVARRHAGAARRSSNSATGGCSMPASRPTMEPAGRSGSHMSIEVRNVTKAFGSFQPCAAST